MNGRTAVVVGITVVGFIGCRSTAPAADGLATVTEVVDGDTVDVEIGGREERVRLIGIDTPETKKPDSPVECFGPEATAFTEGLLSPGTQVRLERDVVGRDDYGRLLAYVYLTTPATGSDPDVFVNLEIVREGLATPLSIEPNTAHAREFASAASAAEATDVGLWAVCPR